MEGGNRAAKKVCVRRVPRARAKQRPVQVLLFIGFEGWKLRVGEKREIEQGVARMHEELEQRERERWLSQQPEIPSWSNQCGSTAWTTSGKPTTCTR
jgi:hypothetical protein